MVCVQVSKSETKCTVSEESCSRSRYEVSRSQQIYLIILTPKMPGHALKFGRIRSRGLGVMGVYVQGRVYYPKISPPIATKLCVGGEHILEQQEKYTDLLYHHAKYGGARRSRAVREAKKSDVLCFLPAALRACA